MVLEITRGKDKGSTLRVVAARPDYVQAMNADGQLVKFTKANFKMFDVCETRALPVAIGDKLLVRSGSGSLTNQQRITFTGWDSSGNPVADGKVIEHRNLCHAYASTPRSVQSSTAARVITGFDRNSVRAATKDIPYVLNSRGREDCQIYVESIADLSQIQNRSGDRKFATKMSVETPKLVARPAQKTDSFDFSPRPDLRRASMHQARSGVDMARGLER
jgi:hypothetical protein